MHVYNEMLDNRVWIEFGPSYSEYCWPLPRWLDWLVCRVSKRARGYHREHGLYG